MFTWLSTNLIWTEGAQILLVTLLIGFGAFLFYRPLLMVVGAFAVFTFFFFRNPERICAQACIDPTVIICPADGKVVDVVMDQHNGLEGFAQKVSIFLSPIDVHVNWIPVAGTITEVVYKEGQFCFAFVPKSSTLNERNDIRITASDGQEVLVRQIAGTIARRICCWVHTGDQVKAGQKFGMIRFGSRVDIFLPANVELMVGIGQRVYGGQTVLGRWLPSEPLTATATA
jgi:phosphatidylserine decarboxylase